VKSKQDKLRELLNVVLSTTPDEIDCDELLARIATCLESLGPNDEIPAEFAAVSQHLEICSECREEYQALVEILRSRPR